MTTTTEPNDRARAMRDRAGTADPATLPISCRCGARWSGTSTAHCPAECHKTFSGVTTFDIHRRGGRCADPEAVGMSRLRNRAYECWGYPGEVSE